MSICVLSHKDLRQWTQSGQRPSCKYHDHTPRHVAEKRVKEDEAHWIPELRAIVIFTCVTDYVLKRTDSAGYQGYQLGPVICPPRQTPVPA